MLILWLSRRAHSTLCRHATGAHAQEAEIPIEEVEEHGADGYAADGVRVGDMPHDSSIHQPDKRDGDVRQDAGNRQSQNLFVGVHLPAVLFADVCARQWQNIIPIYIRGPWGARSPVRCMGST